MEDTTWFLKRTVGFCTVVLSARVNSLVVLSKSSFFYLFNNVIGFRCNLSPVYNPDCCLSNFTLLWLFRSLTTFQVFTFVMNQSLPFVSPLLTKSRWKYDRCSFSLPLVAYFQRLLLPTYVSSPRNSFSFGKSYRVIYDLLIPPIMPNNGKW